MKYRTVAITEPRTDRANGRIRQKFIAALNTQLYSRHFVKSKDDKTIRCRHQNVPAFF